MDSIHRHCETTIMRTLHGLLLALLLTSTAHAEPKDFLELQDGSLLSGQLLSFDGRVYTFESDTLGTLELPAARVVGIRPQQTASEANAASAWTAPAAIDLNPDDDDSGYPGLVDTLIDMQSEPGFQGFLEDVAVLSVIASGDVDRILAHPKLMRLFDNPALLMLLETAAANAQATDPAKTP